MSAGVTSSYSYINSISSLQRAKEELKESISEVERIKKTRYADSSSENKEFFMKSVINSYYLTKGKKDWIDLEK